MSAALATYCDLSPAQQQALFQLALARAELRSVAARLDTIPTGALPPDVALHVLNARALAAYIVRAHVDPADAGVRK